MVCISNVKDVQDFVESTDCLSKLNQIYALAFKAHEERAARIALDKIRFIKTGSSKINSYEVYVAKDKEGNILYIGSGECGRHQHCASGVSHVRELNEMLFTNKEIIVEVLHQSLTKKESLSIEVNLIKQLHPKYNKMHNKRKSKKHASR